MRNLLGFLAVAVALGGCGLQTHQAAPELIRLEEDCTTAKLTFKGARGTEIALGQTTATLNAAGIGVLEVQRKYFFKESPTPYTLHLKYGPDLKGTLTRPIRLSARGLLLDHDDYYAGGFSSKVSDSCGNDRRASGVRGYWDELRTGRAASARIELDVWGAASASSACAAATISGKAHSGAKVVTIDPQFSRLLQDADGSRPVTCKVRVHDELGGWLELELIFDRGNHRHWVCNYPEDACFCRWAGELAVTAGCAAEGYCCVRSTVPVEPHAATQYTAQCSCTRPPPGGQCKSPPTGFRLADRCP